MCALRFNPPAPFAAAIAADPEGFASLAAAAGGRPPAPVTADIRALAAHEAGYPPGTAPLTGPRIERLVHAGMLRREHVGGDVGLSLVATEAGRRAIASLEHRP